MLTRNIFKSLRQFSTKKNITVTFMTKENVLKKTVIVSEGTNMLEAAHENDIDLEGACDASLACSTCHLIVEDQEYFDKLPETTDDEEDMLDLAFGLTHTSRLGCQILATPDIDGIKFILPDATRNMMVDK
jgi:ferredoxin-2, mitochondrial